MTIARRWLTVSEVGEYLSLHPKSVYRACKSRRIPSAKAPGVGVRVDKKALDQLLERLAIGPKEFGMSIRQAEEHRDGH